MGTLDSFTLELDDLKVTHSGLIRPESILAEPDGTLWTDDSRGSLSRIDLDGTITTIGSIRSEPNGFALADDGYFYIPNIGNGKVYKMDKQGNHSVFLEQIEGHDLGAVNYVFIDSQNRTWISVSSREIPWFNSINDPRPDVYIIVIDEKGPRIVADGIFFTNEIRMNADESYLYAAETMKSRILRFKVADNGSLGEAEVFGPDGICEDGYIDGFTFDNEGNIWVTQIVRNGIGIINTEGEYHTVFEDLNQPALDAALEAIKAKTLTPASLFACVGPRVQFPVSITFAGEDLKTVYIGSLAMPHLLSFRSPIAGLKMNHWK